MVQDYDFSIFHKEGRRNYVCDALSRAKVNNITVVEGNVIPPAGELRIAQRNDGKISPYITYLVHGNLPENLGQKEQDKFMKEVENFEIEDDLLFRKRGDDIPVVVIPDQYQEVMLFRAHASVEGMHLGINKTTNTLLTMCWWYKLQADVEQFIKNCHSCMQVKNPQQRIRVPMGGQLPQHPLETVCSDIAGPFPRSLRGNKWIVVFIDQFTKYCDIIPIPDAKAETVAQVFVEEWICRHGICENFLSDQGANYMSAVMKRVHEMFGIRQKRTTPYHPSTNGLAERLIKTIKYCLAHVVDKETQNDWDTYLCFIRMVMNQTWHASINASPAKLFTAREMMTPTKLLLPRIQQNPVSEGEYPEIMEKKIQHIWQLGRQYLATSKEAQKFYYDQKLVPTNIDVGDRVYKYTPRGKAGLATKLLHHWIGPYVVTKVSDTNAWIRPISKLYSDSQCIHLNMLKKYSGTNIPPEDTEIGDDQDSVEEQTAPADADKSAGRAVQGNPNASTDINDHMESGDLVFNSPGEEQVQKEREVERDETKAQRFGLRRRPKPRADDDYYYY
jgi:hypothetical protein